MTPERFLRRLKDAGFHVEADDGDLVVRPARHVTPTLHRRIRAQKYELLTALSECRADPSEPACIDCGRALPLSGVRCPHCRDAHHAATCASCGVEIEGEDDSICDLCGVEARIRLDAETREGA